MVMFPSWCQIKVAVQADRNCVRSYRTQSESKNFNTLSLVLRTSSPDNLLFFQGSNTTVRSCTAPEGHTHSPSQHQ